MSAPVPAVAALLADLAARGVELAAEGTKLRYRPVAAVTGLLADRIKEHKDELLYLLRAAPGYSLAELAVLAREGMTPADVPALDAVKSAFADLGATVIGFEAKPGVPTVDDLPPDIRELYEERAGIMEFDGEMPRWRAERLALRDMVAWMSGTGRNARPVQPSISPEDTEGDGPWPQ